MPNEIRPRFNAAGAGSYPGGLSQSIFLSDMGAFSTPIRAVTSTWYQYFLKDQVLAASGTLDIDLNNPANTTKDAGGNPLQIAKLLWFALSITGPTGTAKVRYGPQGVTNGCPLWFGGVTSTYFADVQEAEIRPFTTGLAITASSASVVRFKNPDSVNPVTFSLWIAGQSAV